MPTTLYENRPSAGIGVVEVQELEVCCDFVLARATLCGDRRGRGAKTRGFFAMLIWLVRPSAKIGVVEVQKLEEFCGDRRGQKLEDFYDFCGARATLCGDRRGRGAKTRGCFYDFCGAHATLCGDRRGRGVKNRGFLRFRRCSRDALRQGSFRVGCLFGTRLTGRPPFD